MSVPNFEILGAVVPKKSLMKKKVYRHTDKHCYERDENYIPSIYFVCQGYNYRSAICAASQLPGRGPTNVDVAPVPAC